ncbi:hypothetical protein LIER_08992 [Lithospermum erythrorhizon]|uniref:Uncharacterized protein n=1 Tax=Lithospermum erythrorhizon TaxID=34254 RepID=A0AAV3PF98_LITER
MPFGSESSSSQKSGKPIVHSNLQSFLDYVTPLVPSKTVPKDFRQDTSLWNPVDKDEIEYFTLQDLWECYEDWSAYGLGVPVLLNNGESVVQYYTPYISAFQIYTNKPKNNLRDVEGSSGGSPSEDQSSTIESGSDKLSRSSSNNSYKTWDATSGDSGSDHGGSSPVKNRLGYLYHQYHEMNSPFWRIPLVEKVAELSENLPGLLSLKSVDLSPASWMSVAWYPIYHIPMKRTEKDLATCFLTYHTLSSTFQGNNDVDPTENGDHGSPVKAQLLSGTAGVKKMKGKNRVPLPPFGLNTYRMQGDVWLNGDPLDYDKMADLYCASDSWLKQLGFRHHDFHFFTSHSE